jgi:hypothetical protein
VRCVGECLTHELYGPLAILPAASELRMISPSGNEETTVTE